MTSVWLLGSTDFQQFAIALGSNGLVGLVIAWVLEKAPGWASPPGWVPSQAWGQWPRLKRWFVFLLTVATPTLFTIVFHNAGPEFLAQRTVWGSLAMQGLVVWVFSQLGHVVDPGRLITLINVVIGYGPLLLEALRAGRPPASAAFPGTLQKRATPGPGEGWDDFLKRAG